MKEHAKKLMLSLHQMTAKAGRREFAYNSGFIRKAENYSYAPGADLLTTGVY